MAAVAKIMVPNIIADAMVVIGATEAAPAFSPAIEVLLLERQRS